MSGACNLIMRCAPRSIITATAGDADKGFDDPSDLLEQVKLQFPLVLILTASLPVQCC